MIAWFKRLVGGWLPLGDKPFPEWLGKILWVVGIYVACTMLLQHFQKPSVTTVAGDQIIQTPESRDMMGLGCSMWRGYIKAGIKTK